ncbi:MAG: hemoglobin/transferrin/lactoferrin receptor protein [Yoonia sp.]|jgi:hemoglobin/transferrin/lactoferrin receptor protein
MRYPIASLSLLISSSLGLVVCPSLALANEVAAANYSANTNTNIETITVSGTKTAREINEIAASVTSIDSQQIDALTANNIRDLLRYEPGVSVEGNGRYGLSSFNIRGINGDRVLILIDGIPIADEFSFGPNLSSRRDVVDIDLVKAVDIVRGPASTLYGSDAIGGVVSFQTKDPLDLIDDDGSFAGRAKLGYVSQSNEKYINLMLAGVANNWQWLVNTTKRSGNETRSFYDDNNIGDARNSTDPQSSDANSVLGKLIYQASPAHRFELITEQFKQSSQTELLSEVSTVVRGTTTLESFGDDEQERKRASIQYLYQANNGGHLQRVTLLAFYQNSFTTQHSQLSRISLVPGSSAFFRTRDSEFEQTTKGFSGQADHQFDWGAQHYLIYGVSYEQTDSIALREGQTQDIASGVDMPEFSVFPARDFPISTLKESSVFIQDEIQLLAGKLILSPGVRYDKFKLNAHIDDLFSAANPGVSVSDFEDSQLSKKLGSVYQLSDDYNVWLQYAEGFRIPPMDDVNIGFTNFLGGYTSLSNPDLKPESVVSIEAGIRGLTSAFSWSLSVYKNDYDDFIESLSFVGIAENGFTQFQAINIDSVEISGIEGQINWRLSESFNSMNNWQVRASFSVQDSKNKATGEELESILPSQTVVGIQYNEIDDPWRLELAATYTRKANAISSDPDSVFFVAPSHVTWDLLGHYNVNDNIKINGGIFNLSDKEYWLASEVRGQSDTANLLPLTSVGRNASVNVIVTF